MRLRRSIDNAPWRDREFNSDSMYGFCKPSRFPQFIYMLIFVSCTGNACSQPIDTLRIWKWEEVTIPNYTWPRATPFGNGLHVDVAYDPNGVSIVGDRIRFFVDPTQPKVPNEGDSNYNYRSEIRTAPWKIHHPLGTEQWIGFDYIFSEDYKIDPTSPITIYQNHPGVTGIPPQFELELAALSRPRPATGGEVQVVNHTNGVDSSHPRRGDRIVTSIKPVEGDTLKVIVHVVYGRGEQGLLQIWLNEILCYDQSTSTVYDDYQWGGNNKWGIYHHTHRRSTDVASTQWEGIYNMSLSMGTLKLLTRYPGQPHYLENAYDLVKPD